MFVFVWLGHQVVRVRAIFLPILSTTNYSPKHHRIAAYVERYDIKTSPADGNGNPDFATGCFILKPVKRADMTVMGDIIPLNQIREIVELTPAFGAKANPRFHKTNVLQYADSFLLDKYFDKELFYALHNKQYHR